MMAPNTERPLDGGEGHAGKTARGPRHGDRRTSDAEGDDEDDVEETRASANQQRG